MMRIKLQLSAITSPVSLDDGTTNNVDDQENEILNETDLV